jgi:exonuclease III
MIESVKSLKVLQWNANGIRNKIIEFYDFILENGADVVCLNEKFLNPDIKLPSNPKFSIIRLDRLSISKCGLAILIKNHIKHEPMPHIKTHILECLGIRICLDNGRKIEIIAAYLPGGTTTAQINQHYVRDLEILARRNCSYFVCGDLNSKHRFWNCQRANRAGTLLYQEYIVETFLLRIRQVQHFIQLTSISYRQL